jgi:hypothetical protein
MVVEVCENHLTGRSDHDPMNPRMFRSGKGTSMNTRMYATQADVMAGNARVRASQTCPVSVVFAPWSPISLGTTAAAKHGRPRRLEVSHP